MFLFISGMMFGAMLGVAFLALVSANRDDDIPMPPSDPDAHSCEWDYI